MLDCYCIDEDFTIELLKKNYEMLKIQIQSYV